MTPNHISRSITRSKSAAWRRGEIRDAGRTPRRERHVGAQDGFGTQPLNARTWEEMSRGAAQDSVSSEPFLCISAFLADAIVRWFRGVSGRFHSSHPLSGGNMGKLWTLLGSSLGDNGNNEGSRARNLHFRSTFADWESKFDPLEHLVTTGVRPCVTRDAYRHAVEVFPFFSTPFIAN